LAEKRHLAPKNLPIWQKNDPSLFILIPKNGVFQCSSDLQKILPSPFFPLRRRKNNYSIQPASKIPAGFSRTAFGKTTAGTLIPPILGVAY
jgi:hypothetical protein